MSGGGKGGQQSTKVDPMLKQAARDVLDFGAAAAAVPFSPNRGVQFAAFTPQQEAGMGAANDAASAFGMRTAEPLAMPQAYTTASGITGYATGADYDEMRNASMSPELQAAINALFADPVTGQFNGPGGPLMQANYGGGGAGGGSGGTGGGLSYGGSTGLGGNSSGSDALGGVSETTGGTTTTTSGGGGFFRDFYDGGGLGASGNDFKGGGLVSHALNVGGAEPAGSDGGGK